MLSPCCGVLRSPLLSPSVADGLACPRCDAAAVAVGLAFAVALGEAETVAFGDAVAGAAGEAATFGEAVAAV